MNLQSGRGLLVQESRELLSAMEQALLEMEGKLASPEGVNAAFRAAHTIKGSAGLFGLELIVTFTQTVESVLELVRSGAFTDSGQLVSLLLECTDYIASMIDAIEQCHENDDPSPGTREKLLVQLSEIIDASGKPNKRGAGRRNSAAVASAPSRAQASTPAPVEPVVVAPVEAPAPAPVLPQASPAAFDFWRETNESVTHLTLRFGLYALQNDVDPVDVLLRIRDICEIVYVYTYTAEIPALEELNPTQQHLRCELGINKVQDAASLQALLDLVRRAGEVCVIPPGSPAQAYLAVLETVGDDGEFLEECMAEWHGIAQEPPLAPVAAPSAPPPPAPVSTERLDAEPTPARTNASPAPAPAASAEGSSKSAAANKGADGRIVKVEAHKLDHLIGLVGELVIACEGSKLAAAKAKALDVSESLDKVSDLVERIRDRALNLRMVPIGEVFQRFPRVVRDVSKELGKRIELTITGADTELDKSMVDRLSDPLMHIVRNSIDHGIESVEAREAHGKSPVGNVRLHAFHESGCIVVEISDDGRGLQRERILAKAVERGLVAPGAALSDAEVYKLIFMPGFSTAEQVTNLSGRGVGMDVVRRNVEQLRGEIEIDSEAGKGTRMRIRLPLTLAIIDGFQVAVGDSIFVIPLDLVVECVDMAPGMGGQHLVSLRGEPLPYLRLRELFSTPGETQGRESLVVVSYGAQRFGIVVDRLLGDFQAVIKPLGQIFRGIRAVSSSTILGDGSVALILDVPSLLATTNQAEKSTNDTNKPERL
jgi:two-component system chemotaxis sensor kinase CheA